MKVRGKNTYKPLTKAFLCICKQENEEEDAKVDWKL